MQTPAPALYQAVRDENRERLNFQDGRRRSKPFPPDPARFEVARQVSTDLPLSNNDMFKFKLSRKAFPDIAESVPLDSASSSIRYAQLASRENQIKPHWVATHLPKYTHSQVLEFELKSLFLEGEFYIQYVEKKPGSESNLCVWAERMLTGDEREDIRLACLAASGYDQKSRRSPWQVSSD
ncbi:hypothetical protein H072_10701 [Dactylellina haptotyla CBS 200.50]|uniref:Uncharacterized protein n=1 Tax=Dactylellina haptotyla (strain CBS 200.50) TaxID=1284197 RepID=S7ZYC2_DACHA|nr:hypothetical protein H072_10701 [Dactylellina haptotyla CBS 200.50]